MSILEYILMIASIITAGTVITIFILKTFKTIRKFIRFLDDFNGVEERPGIDRRPGFPERIKELEECMQGVSSKMDDFSDTSDIVKKINNKVTSIEKELHPNSGTSMRDAVDKIQLRLDLVEEKLKSYARS